MRTPSDSAPSHHRVNGPSISPILECATTGGRPRPRTRISPKRVQSLRLTVLLLPGGLSCAILLFVIWRSSESEYGETLQEAMFSFLIVAPVSLLTMAAVPTHSRTPEA